MPIDVTRTTFWHVKYKVKYVGIYGPDEKKSQ
jgi:hypothetical protein